VKEDDGTDDTDEYNDRVGKEAVGACVLEFVRVAVYVFVIVFLIKLSVDVCVEYIDSLIVTVSVVVTNGEFVKERVLT